MFCEIAAWASSVFVLCFNSPVRSRYTQGQGQFLQENEIENTFTFFFFFFQFLFSGISATVPREAFWAMNMLPSTHRLQFVNFQTFLDLVVLRGARFSVNEPLSSVYSKSFPEENNFRALNPRMHQYVSEDKKWSVSKTPVNLHGAGHLYPTYVFLSISCTADWARAQSGLWDPS